MCIRDRADTLAARGLPPDTGIAHRLPHFQHLFAGDGYAAGYYVYLWAEVLDAHGYDAFLETGEIVSTRGRDPEKTERDDSRAGDLSDGKPLIVLGKGGQTIKAIGAGARKQLEEIVGRRVHLMLRVKLRSSDIRGSSASTN